jgi:hypothetical protein
MPLSYARALATDGEVIDHYYDLLEDTLRANNMFNDPQRIYNCDETGLPLNPKPLKVVDAVGAKNPSHITGDTKSQVTVLACTNAAGFTIPPFVIFDRQSLNPQMIKGEVPGSIYGLSSNGWITQELFCDWFSKHFLAYAPSIRPLLLLMDGHSSHYCPEVIRIAAAAQVILFTLPPHTTHLTQPLDKSAFSSLKVCWKHVCHDFIAQNPGRVVSRYDFCSLLSTAWSTAMTIKNVVAGFRVTGVCPFNRTAIKIPGKYTAFNPESLPQSTGLAYIPLYSPAHSRTHPRFVHCDNLQQHSSRPDLQLVERDNVSDFEDSISVHVDSGSEGSDDSPSNRCAILPLQDSRTLSKFLRTPMAPGEVPTKHQKSSGKVLTSVENMRIMEAREREKQQKAKLKEERRKIKEEKLRKKQFLSGPCDVSEKASVCHKKGEVTCDLATLKVRTTKAKSAAGVQLIPENRDNATCESVTPVIDLSPPQIKKQVEDEDTLLTFPVCLDTPCQNRKAKEFVALTQVCPNGGDKRVKVACDLATSKTCTSTSASSSVVSRPQIEKRVQGV